MSKAKTPMVYFLSLSLVFAFMVTTIPTLATAETLSPSEPGVSFGKPLSDATLKETTAMGTVTGTVTTYTKVINGTGTATSTVLINGTPINYNNGSGTQPQTTGPTPISFSFHKKW